MTAPYYSSGGIEIYLGDCREVVPSIGKTVATVITDPPYGLEFMGQGWDHGVPDAETWLAFDSSLVPGSLILAFGGTRTWHRLTCAIEDAGYEIRDCLLWLYGQGFPKSRNISKAIDAEAGAVRGVVGARPIAYEDSPSGYTSTSKNSTARGGGIWNPITGGTEHGRPITAPATPAAKLWSGWGTALKPAWEPIILAMKSLDGTFAQNAIKHGVAGLNVEGGRIGLSDHEPYNLDGKVRPNVSGSKTEWQGPTPEAGWKPSAGRFPANLLLDEAAAAMLDEQSGELKPGWFADMDRGEPRDVSQSRGAEYRHATGRKASCIGDSGGASRFFYTAKASPTDRGNVKAGPLPLFGEPEYEDRNEHPTVKPTSVMEYLCRLTASPTGGLVLDPFMGSGTTLVAAKRVGRPAVGVELEERWAEFAAKRLDRVTVGPTEEGST